MPIIEAPSTASGATKEFFVPLTYRYNTSVTHPYDGDVGHFAVGLMGSSGGGRFNFFIPNDFISLSAAKIVIIPDATETIDYDVYVHYAALGESYSNHTSNVTFQNLAVTQDKITEIDISARFASLAANDYVGVNFLSNTSTLQVVGLRIKYA